MAERRKDETMTDPEIIKLFSYSAQPGIFFANKNEKCQ